MKKLFLLAVLAGSAVLVKAQDLDDISKMVYLKQTAKAKEAIDKYLAVEKNAKKPEGWYWKAVIVNQMSKDSTKSIEENSALKTEAFDLFKKYRQIDPKAALLEEEHNSSIYDLYANLGWELGVKAYNAKNFNASFDNFKKALEVHDYGVANGLVFNDGSKFPALDTLFTQYAAITAIEAKRLDEAATYHKKIVDAGLSGDSYADSYNFLVDYYKNKKDKAAFADIIGKAKTLYPTNNRYWTVVEIEVETEGIAKPDVFQKYEELLTKNPGSYDVAYNYAAELFNYVNATETPAASAAEYKKKLVEILKKAIAIKSTFEANFVMTVTLYNNSFDISDEASKIKGLKADDLKKKKALQNDAMQALNEAIPYGEAGVKLFSEIDKPTGSEKGNYRKLLSMMKNMYEVKKDAAKTAEYDAKMKAFQ